MKHAELEEKRRELTGLLAAYASLRPDIGYAPEQMALTVIVPPPWSAGTEPDALAAQRKIKEWSEQYPELVCYCFDSFSTLLYVLK